MTETEYRKEILLHKIDSHRRVFGVELDSVKAAARPLTSLFSVGQKVATAAGLLRALLKTDDGDSNDYGRILNIETLLVIAVSSLASALRRKTKD
jgi:hypothetical protein